MALPIICALRLLMFAMWACVTFPLTVLGGIIGHLLSAGFVT